MTAYAPTAFAPVAPKPRLALVALIVLTMHALLLLGLPHWVRTVRIAGGPPVFQIRTIALAPPQSADAPAEPVAKPPPQPNKPRPKPSPKAPPTPVARVNDPPPPLHSGTATLGNNLPLPVVTVSNTLPLASPASDTLPSLLQSHVGAGFGGRAALPPIVAPLPPDQAAAVIQQAAQPRLAGSATLDTASAPGTPDTIPPVQLPHPTEMIYKATVTEDGRQTTLATTINWRYDEQSNYDLRWTLYGPAIGDRSRYATGLVTVRGLAPVAVQVMGSDAHNLTFDYAQARLRDEPLPPTASGTVFPRPAASDAIPAASATSQPPANAPLLPGVQDPLSLLIELGALIAGQPSQYTVGNRIALPVADGGSPGARLTEFTVADEGDFALPGRFAGQPLPALHLVHEATHDHDARIELWLGKRLDYLPVRLLIRQPNGGLLDAILQSAELQTVQTPSLPAASSTPASGASNAVEDSRASSLYQG